MVPSLLLLLASQAADADRSHAASLVFCEAPPGHYDTQPVPNGSLAGVSARVRLIEVKPDATWWPAAGIVFKVIGLPTHVGVQVFVDPNHPKQLTVGLRKPLDDRPVVLMRSPRDAEIVVRAAVQGRVLTVWAGSKVQSLRLKNDVEPPILMCSSGSFEFAF